MTEYIFEINDILYDSETGEGVMKPKCKGELIRCGNCAYWNGSCFLFGGMGSVHLTEDDFCSAAVKRDEVAKD